MSLLEKAADDPFYAPLVSQGADEKFLLAAGYFDDEFLHSSIKTIDHRWMLTPLGKLQRNLEECQEEHEHAVLFTTGGFAPIHQGHLDALETAKTTLESQGKHVVGGFISPDHDTYMSTKNIPEMSALRRLDYVRTATADSSWLEADSFASLGMSRDINFTTLIARLENYLAYHLHPQELQVYYVFGGDNAGFAAAFSHHGQAVIITRDGKGDEVSTQPWFNKKRVVIAQGSNDLSSTIIRAQSVTVVEQEELPSAMTYVLRNDMSFAASNEETDAFVHELAAVLEENSPRHVRTKIAYRDQQIEEFTRKNIFEHPTLSLDVCYEGDAQVHISRLFDLGSTQHHSRTLIARPESQPLPEQIAELKSGAYELVDDDIATGYTVQTLKAMLPQNITIAGTHAFVEVLDVENKIYDVVDARDFLLSAACGGLVITLPNKQITRVPYVFPYVNLVTRAKIPAQNVVGFSRSIWQLNAEFYQNKNTRVKDLHEINQRLWIYLGFELETRLHDVCLWHLDNMHVKRYSQ